MRTIHNAAVTPEGGSEELLEVRIRHDRSASFSVAYRTCRSVYATGTNVRLPKSSKARTDGRPHLPARRNCRPDTTAIAEALHILE
jgi:hypothetical protein